MKPYDLYYNTKEEYITKDLEVLIGCYYNHIPEVTVYDRLPLDKENTKIEIKMIKDHCFDSRRIWRLATVWYDNKPVMITQNAGREGDDHRARFITNKELYIKMCQYIQSLLAIDKDDSTIDKDLIDEQDDYLLNSFYGSDLKTVSRERY